MKQGIYLLLTLILLSSCDFQFPTSDEGITKISTDSHAANDVPVIDSALMVDSITSVDRTTNRDTVMLPPSKVINTKNVNPIDLINFAKTLDHVPYKYGSTDPNVGFDCSGFITYVFNHFKIAVPRSSIDFTNVGKDVDERTAKPGDLILFTGTDSTERFVGHMGIITQPYPQLSFIHSSSGKANGVVITPLNDYYRSRFVKIVRIFPQNN